MSMMKMVDPDRVKNSHSLVYNGVKIIIQEHSPGVWSANIFEDGTLLFGASDHERAEVIQLAKDFIDRKG